MTDDDDELDYWLASGDLPTAFAATQEDSPPESGSRFWYIAGLVAGLIAFLGWLIWK